ncbi:hypothetical protein H4R18_001690 [Coemansia javaensis]|uniref:Uncharacterized protein n=1 Tax=Coemansia javaensis TaxID=2761396 RepID=A0A9W8LIU2_9FUNG|nr:hypothetical protein H4R18_001690 [Coemansia javaensis]
MASSSIEFVATLRIRQACAGAAGGGWADSGEAARIAAIGSGASDRISLADVEALSRRLRAQGGAGGEPWVHQLLRGSRMHVAAPAPRERDPALDARLDKIRRQLEEQEYRRMTAGVVPLPAAAAEPLAAVPGVRTGQSAPPTAVKQELRDVNRAVSAIVNILFSAVGVGFAVGYASYAVTPEIGWRVLMALGAAAAIALAETWLYVFAGTRGQKKRLQRLTGASVAEN